MPVLSDADLFECLKSNRPDGAALIAGAKIGDSLTRDTKEDLWIQGASLDLTVGRIARPSSDSKSQPDNIIWEERICLAPSCTAIVQTKETLQMPSDLVGIIETPYSLSSKAIMLASTGQIDPGYRGPLHLTIINMGNESEPIYKGLRIASAVFIKLIQPAVRGYNDHQRIREELDGSALSREDALKSNLRRLPADVFRIGQRAKEEATKAVRQHAGWAMVPPLGVTVLGGIFLFLLGQYLGSLGGWEAEMRELRAEVQSLAARLEGLDAAFQRLPQQPAP